MKAEEFRKWLAARDVKPNAISTRIHAVRTIERNLAKLGSVFTVLEAAHAEDATLADLRREVGALRDDFRSGGTKFRMLMPESEKPDNRLASWRSWLSQYARFLNELAGTAPKASWPQLEAMREIFLDRMPDFENFEQIAGKFAEDETQYKKLLCSQVQSLAASAEDNRTVGERIYKLLATGGQGRPLLWRTLSDIEQAGEPGAEAFAAVGTLARSGEPTVDAVETAARQFEGARARGVKALRKGEVLNIAISTVACLRPGEASWFKITKIDELSRRLLGRRLFNGPLFERADFVEYQKLFDRIFAVMRDEWDWKPRDFFDVQGFAWVALDAGWEVDDSEEPVSDEMADATAIPVDATNLILFGPPGTGKTYRTMEEAVRLCGQAVPEDRIELRKAYDLLVGAGQIAFATFHQNYSYEEFVEGLRPVTSDADDGVATGFRLEPRPGVFRRIAALAEQARHKPVAGGWYDMGNRHVFKMSLGRYGAEDHIYDDAISGGYVVLGWGGNVDWSGPEFDGDGGYQAIFDRWRQDHPGASGNDSNITQLWRFRTTMKVGDLVVVSAGNSQFRAIGEVSGEYQFVPNETGDYSHRRSIRWLLVLDEPLAVSTIYNGPLSQRSCYPLKEAQLKRDALSRLLPGDKGVALPTQDQFVLIIDEINRANISKVFGELITLLEPDKRLGAPNELKVILPYSNETFGVPSNLHVVGTMNTADRSIALLDTALRRRFDFRELMPEPDLLPIEVDGVPLRAVLRTLNERIEYLFDREHQVGHAYFIHCRSKDAIDGVMRRKVIPLLAEYFYENWEKVALVLGDAEGRGGFLDREAITAPKGMARDGDPIDRVRWIVKDVFHLDAYDLVA